MMPHGWCLVGEVIWGMLRGGCREGGATGLMARRGWHFWDATWAIPHEWCHIGGCHTGDTTRVTPCW